MALPGARFFYAGDATEWNDLEITAQGTRISASLNGMKMMEWDGAGVLDDEVHRERGVGLKGSIALQIHTGDQLRIQFRNVRIREN
jgi:hypothetical protein